MPEDVIAEAARSSVKMTLSYIDSNGDTEVGRVAQQRQMEETDHTHYMNPAVNYLSYEPNFLFKEFAKD